MTEISISKTGLIFLVILMISTITYYGCEIWKGLAVPESKETKEWFFENSDVISYVEVLEVDRRIEEPTELLPPGSRDVFLKQQAKIKFLKILKGPKELENTTDNIVKKRAYFFLTEKERLVLYLRKRLCSYHTFSVSQGEWRLASALADVNSLKKDTESGIVVGVLNKGNLQDLRIHILQRRHKAPVILDSESWKNNLVRREKIGEFDIAEIPLAQGAFTVLLELKENLYSFNQLVDRYYPYVILEENNWQAIYFDIEAIKKICKRGAS